MPRTSALRFDCESRRASAVRRLHIDNLGAMSSHWPIARAPDFAFCACRSEKIGICRPYTRRPCDAPRAPTHGTISEPPPRPSQAGSMAAGIGCGHRDVAVLRRALERNPPRVASARRTLLATPAAGYAGCCAAIRDMDQRADLGRIHVPTLVIAGDQDISMPWPEHGGGLASAISGATAVRLNAAHVSNGGPAVRAALRGSCCLQCRQQQAGIPCAARFGRRNVDARPRRDATSIEFQDLSTPRMGCRLGRMLDRARRLMY